MRYLDPTLLNTFIVLAQCGQFTKTADIVGLSQSAVSQQIQKLEKTLGTSLIHRTKRDIKLTPQGDVLLIKAQQLLLQHELVISELNQTRLSGRIRFGAPEDFTTTYLPSILSRFSKIYPNVHLDVRCQLTVPLLEGFEQGNFDLVIAKTNRKRRLAHTHKLWEEPLVWVHSPEYPLQEAINERSISLVLSPEPCVYRAHAVKLLEKHQYQYEHVFTSPSLAGSLAAVRGGLGVSVQPLTSVPIDLSHSTSSTPNGLPALGMSEISLLAKENQPPVIAAFQQFIEEALEHTIH
ncbi:MAG: LysR family transcriptional regulator [Vampirovibrionales bacterium]|nr:LysR family transcriptional regulator [Vampirovibrionales bacterium]